MLKVYLENIIVNAIILNINDYLNEEFMKILEKVSSEI